MAYKNANIQQDNKSVTYLNKTFGDFKANLIDFAKQYYPDAYNDFNEADPGTMFIEMSSYVGDVLSFYADYLFKENLIQYAEERGNVYAIAQALGYKPNISVSSNVFLDFFQLVPPTGSGSDIAPDYRYSLMIRQDAGIRADNGSEFRTIEPVNFASDSTYNTREVSVYSVDSTGTPEYYLLKKSVRANSGEVKEKNFEITGTEKNLKILLPDEQIVSILSVTDSNGKTWTEVDYLAQETVFSEKVNSHTNDPTLSNQSDATPYLLSLHKVPRRFITRVNSENRLEMQFGSGISSNPDEVIIPNPDNVGSGLPGSVNNIDRAFDPSNFIFTKTYGQAPKDVTLTVKYLVGRGIEDNVGGSTVSDIFTSVLDLDTTELNNSTVDTVKNSVACINPSPAQGAKSADTIEDVKNNSLATFRTQNRAVTKQDYLIRTYSMPPRFGSIAKAYIAQDVQTRSQIDAQVRYNPLDVINNPLALNLHVLGFNSDKQLTEVNNATKQNLRNYLSQYRLLTDGINILNAFPINIAVYFHIVPLPGFNAREVILSCVERIKDYFDIDKWQINQPIILKDITTLLATTQGVQSVIGDPVIENRWKPSDGYSGNTYDIDSATKNGIIYPSMDPAIFEVKYPNADIQGRAVPITS